ncbi:MAG: serine protease [Deltaproteobacteria bacterium]|nr:serine protease [Deltaproteobacteria bacterium]
MSTEETSEQRAGGTMAMIRARTSQIVLIQDSKGLGTGLAVATDGWILTNKHVAPSIGPFRVILANGQNVPGVGVHQSAHHDLALVKVAVPTKDYLDLDSQIAEDYTVGEEVFALGHPRGCRFSVSRGIISNPHREFEKEYFVQTDVAINPGNSGGPLLNAQGALVGIVTMTLNFSQGLGFCVPGDTAADYVRYARRLVRQGVVKVPEVLLANAAQPQQPARDVVFGAIGVLAEAGKVSIEEEKPEEGFCKLKRKSAEIEIHVENEVLRVSGRVVRMGPGERGNAKLLLQLLQKNGTELGGPCFYIASDDELRIGLIRPTTGLDALQAFWAIDHVSHLVEDYAPKVTAMVFGMGATLNNTDASNPGYPIIQLPNAPTTEPPKG